MSHTNKKKKNIKDFSEEEKILKEICQEISHHDILSFKLDNKSLNNILSELEPFNKNFFRYQRYDFKLQDLDPELCSIYDIKMEKEKNKNIIKNTIDENNDVNLIDEDGKKKMINDILSDKNMQISEVLENIMEDVNIFDKIYQEEQNKIENEKIQIKISKTMTKNELKYLYFQQSKENEKSKIIKDNSKKLYPLEMINKIENDYNKESVEKIKNETDFNDLYPLDTYKKNHELKVQLLLENVKDDQFQSLKEKMIIRENDNTEKKDIVNVLVVDNPYQEPGDPNPIYIYAGTEMGKIAKILLNNKKFQNTQDNNESSIIEMLESKEDGINCIDIYENNMVTGHQNGSILFWEDNKINDKPHFQNKMAIIYLKIFKIVKKKKIEIIFSDKSGKVYYLGREKGILNYSYKKELIFKDNETITYKISFFSPENDFQKNNKKRMLFALTSNKGINLIQIRSKKESKKETKETKETKEEKETKETKEEKDEKEEKEGKEAKYYKYVIKTINSPLGKMDEGIFDSSFGYGFPPTQEVVQKNDVRSSISGSIVISKDKIENLLFAASFGEVINLYEVNYNYAKNNKSCSFSIRPIGHFVYDTQIINISFLTNSYIAIITSDYFLEIINTFAFDKNEFKNRHEPTKNNILSYEPIELKKLIMLRQKLDNNYCIYINSIISLNKSILILGRQNLYQFTLLQWDSIIQSLDRAKEYEKMLWLAMVIFHGNKNLLTIESTKNKSEDFIKDINYQTCSPIISKFLIIVVIPELEKNNSCPLRMLIEFCIGTDLYRCLYEAVFPLKKKGYDNHLYRNLTKYILNDKCNKTVFESNFLIDYIKYYVDIGEKNIVSEALFHIDIFSIIEQKKVLSFIEKYKLINIALYSQIKTMEAGQFDHFKPIKYLYDLFHNDLCEEKEKELLKNESYKAIKEKYHKLIKESDNQYYNEDISTYYEYLGHKMLWFCDKCLSGEEFHSEIVISSNKSKIAKKIIIFLTIKEIMNEFLEFDSYSYFQVISRFFTENDLFKLIHRDIKSDKDLFIDLKQFVETYLGASTPTNNLIDKYFFTKIQESVQTFKNIYILYDFYKFISMICANNSEFILDKTTVKNAILFFINCLQDLKYTDFTDKFNCHKKIDDIEEKRNQIEEIEKILLLLIKSLKRKNELTGEDITEFLKMNNITSFIKTCTFLYQESNQFEEIFKLRKNELDEENTNISKSEKIASLFKWINQTLQNTLDLEGEMAEEGAEKETSHQKFKNFLLPYFNYLSDLSLNELSDLVEKWYKGQEEIIISRLNDTKSTALQFKYINYYLATHEYNSEQNDENNTYYKILLLKIDLLIQTNNKEQILNVLHHNSFLCTLSLIKKLLSNEVYDACIYAYQKLGKLDEGIKLAKDETSKALDELFEEINSKKYLSSEIENKLIKFKKFVDLGLGICQKTEGKNEKDLVANYWSLLITSIYDFQNKFMPEFNKNKNNYKTEDYIKINNALNEAFDLILSKMTNQISLPVILDLMGEKCGDAGFTKFRELNFMMFSNFRLSENILELSSNLIGKRIGIEIDNYLYERNKGHSAIFRKCDECHEYLGIGNIDEIKYFRCNHIFHKVCFLQKEINDECYICRKNDCVSEIYESNRFDKVDEERHKAIVEKMRKKEEEENRKNKRRAKLIQLKRINKKKREINYTLNNNINVYLEGE